MKLFTQRDSALSQRESAPPRDCLPVANSRRGAPEHSASGHDCSGDTISRRGAPEFISPPRQRWVAFSENGERQRRGTTKLKIALLVLTFFLLPAPAHAQGCAMCYSNAAGSTKDGQKAISKAVIVLLIPPLGFMTVGMGLAFRYGRRRDQDTALQINDDGEL